MELKRKISTYNLKYINIGSKKFFLTNSWSISLNIIIFLILMSLNHVLEVTLYISEILWRICAFKLGYSDSPIGDLRSYLRYISISSKLEVEGDG